MSKYGSPNQLNCILLSEIKWTLLYDQHHALIDKEIKSCKAALCGGNGVNKTLDRSKKLKGVVCADLKKVFVTRRSVMITFIVNNGSTIIDIDTLGQVVMTCITENKIENIAISGGHEVSER